MTLYPTSEVLILWKRMRNEAVTKLLLEFAQLFHVLIPFHLVECLESLLFALGSRLRHI